MDETSEPKYFCPVCQTGFSDEVLEERLAIRRYHEVYCREHFRKKFPDECEDHPGTLLSAQCSICGRRVCENCYIKLRGQRICSRCKPAMMVEMRIGRPARRVEKRYWGPARITKGLADKFRARHRKSRQREGESELIDKINYLGMMSFIGLGFVSVLVVILYMVHKGRVARGEENPSGRVNSSVIVAVATGIGWLLMYIFYFSYYGF